MLLAPATTLPQVSLPLLATASERESSSDAPTPAMLQQASQIHGSPTRDSDLSIMSLVIIDSTDDAAAGASPDVSSDSTLKPTAASEIGLTAASTDKSGEESVSVLTDVTEPVKHDTASTDFTAKNLLSIQTKRAISIQTAFRHYRDKIDRVSRGIMMENMTFLNQLIPYSRTASSVNKEVFDAEAVARNLNDHERSELERLAEYFDLLWEPTVETELIELSLIAAYLRLAIRSKCMACTGLALTQAIQVRSDLRLPKARRDQVCVCTVGGHMMCCIGDPKKKNSMILDPWTRYLTLPPHKKWRPSEVLWTQSVRERGFMGSVAQYKQFLADHPNHFVPKHIFIEKNTAFTFLSQSITAADIGLDYSVSSATTGSTRSKTSGASSSSKSSTSDSSSDPSDDTFGDHLDLLPLDQS